MAVKGEPRTYFAPAGRESPADLRRKEHLLRHAPLLQQTIDAMSDVVLILNTVVAPPEFYGQLARHGRWGQSHGVRLALVRCRHVPLPVALSILVQLRSGDLAAIASRLDVPEPVRSAAAALKEKEDKGLRRVIEYPPHDSRSAPAACESEGLR